MKRSRDSQIGGDLRMTRSQVFPDCMGWGQVYKNSRKTGRHGGGGVGEKM